MSDPRRYLDGDANRLSAGRSLLESARDVPRLSDEARDRMASRIAATTGTPIASRTMWPRLGIAGGTIGLASIALLIVSRAHVSPPGPAPHVLLARDAPVVSSQPPVAPPVAEPVVLAAASVVNNPMTVANTVLESSVHAARASHAAPVARTAPPAASSGETEDQLLERARSLIDRDPVQALGVIREDSARYPNGPLSQEREFIEIRVQDRLGHANEVRRLGDAFLRRYPGGIYAASVRRFMGQSP